MKSLQTFACLAVLACILGVVGCGNKSDPSAGVPKEKLAPPATDLGNDPEYAKQFGGGGGAKDKTETEKK